MCNLTRTSIWLNLVVRLICSIWRRRQSDKLAAKAIWCLSGNQSHVARKLPAPNASDQSQQRGPDQIARLRRAGLGPDWGQIGVCQSGNLAIRRKFCQIALDWPDSSITQLTCWWPLMPRHICHGRASRPQHDRYDAPRSLRCRTHHHAPDR